MAEPKEILKRYTIIGSESGVYDPKNTISQEELFNLKCIEELIAGCKQEVIIDVLKEAAKNNLTHSETLARTLALCSKSDNLQLKSLAHSALPSIVTSPRILFQFVKYAKEIATYKKTGMWGEGFRKALSKWYTGKDAKTLAAILVAEMSGCQWSHKDILRLIHYKAPSPEIDAVIKYFAFKKSEARSSLNEDSENIAKQVDELSTCTDGLQAAALISKLKLNSSAIPARFQHSPKVWANHIKSLPLTEVLQSLEHFTESKSLSAVVLPEITALLRDADASVLDPADVFISLRRYEVSEHNLRRERAIGKSKKLTTESGDSKSTKVAKGKVKKGPPKPSPTTVSAVQSLLKKSFTALPTGQKELLIVLDFSGGSSSSCPGLQSVSVGGAAALIAHYLKHVGRATTVVAFDVGEIELESDVLKTSAVFSKLKTQNKGGAHEALDRALRKPPKADTIVVLSTNVSCDATEQLEKSQVLMNKYRKDTSNPALRLVVVFLKWTKGIKSNDDPNVLAVCGFDNKVPRIINAFSRGDF